MFSSPIYHTIFLLIALPICIALSIQVPIHDGDSDFYETKSPIMISWRLGAGDTTGTQDTGSFTIHSIFMGVERDMGTWLNDSQAIISKPLARVNWTVVPGADVNNQGFVSVKIDEVGFYRFGAKSLLTNKFSSNTSVIQLAEVGTLAIVSEMIIVTATLVEEPSASTIEVIEMPVDASAVNQQGSRPSKVIPMLLGIGFGLVIITIIGILLIFRRKRLRRLAHQTAYTQPQPWVTFLDRQNSSSSTSSSVSKSESFSSQTPTPEGTLPTAPIAPGINVRQLEQEYDLESQTSAVALAESSVSSRIEEKQPIVDEKHPPFALGLALQPPGNVQFPNNPPLLSPRNAQFTFSSTPASSSSQSSGRDADTAAQARIRVLERTIENLVASGVQANTQGAWTVEEPPPYIGVPKR